MVASPAGYLVYYEEKPPARSVFQELRDDVLLVTSAAVVAIIAIVLSDLT